MRVKTDRSAQSWRRDTGAERRARTREKLISAAARVVAEMGERKARIDDFITAAGVARGTFYNYYSTREELLDDLWARVGREPFDEIRRATQSIVDPAEQLAAEARQILDRAAKDQIWGWLVYAFSGENTVPEDLLSYPRPTLVIGHRSGRFQFSNLDSASDLVVGTLRAALRALLERGRSEDYACAIVILLLRALGVPEREAKAIATKPLSSVNQRRQGGNPKT
jgi:AcrR family transcriptional regulator